MLPEQLAELMTEYERLRPLVAALHGRIARTANQAAVRACAKRLGILTRQGMDFGHPLMLDIFQDYLLYMYRPNGVSLVRKMRNRRIWPPDSEEQQLLVRMDQARFSLFLLQEIYPEGGALALDLATGAKRYVLDRFLPDQKLGNVLAGLRLFPLQDAWMHTGAPLVYGEVAATDAVPPMMPPEGGEGDERLLNEACIRRWLAMFSDRDG